MLARYSPFILAVLVGFGADLAFRGFWEPLPDVVAGAGNNMGLAAATMAVLVLVALVIAAGEIFYRVVDRRREARMAQRARDAEVAKLSWRLEFALSSSGLGVWDVDLKTDRMIWDSRIRELFGVTRRAAYYHEEDWLGVVHPDDRERALADVKVAIEANGRFGTEYRVLLPDGAIRHVEDVAAVYRGEDGSHRLVGLVRDVTDEYLARAELEQRRLEAEAAVLAKAQFLATMSHEIRTPMTGVLGMLDLMMSEPGSEKQPERLAIAAHSAQGLLRILNDILDFSKLEAGRFELAPEPTRPRRVVGEVIALMSASAERKDLELECTIEQRVPEWVIVDGARLRQVLTNIISNAVKFTDDGRISVRVDYAADGAPEARGVLRIAVEDTGVGIAPEMKGRLFQKFVQADSSASRRAGGTGLGLAISREMVELMGGEFTVSSVPGMGSTFSFTISVDPVVGEMPVDEDEPEVDRGPRPMRVLVAEDNVTNQHLVRALLEREGHDVLIVEDGARAVRAAEAERFDVILMDVQMPRMDGPAATRAIRASGGASAEVPIIALTANALASDRATYLAAGMTDYVSKPIDPRELKRALARAVERGGRVARHPAAEDLRASG